MKGNRQVQLTSILLTLIAIATSLGALVIDNVITSVFPPVHIGFARVALWLSVVVAILFAIFLLLRARRLMMIAAVSAILIVVATEISMVVARAQGW